MFVQECGFACVFMHALVKGDLVCLWKLLCLHLLFLEECVNLGVHLDVM